MGLRGPKPKGQEDWMIPVAELMVKEHMNFTSACMAMGRKYTSGQDELADQYSDAFQNVLDGISYKFYARIGDNPLLTKGVLAGVLMTAVRRLGEAGDWSSVHMPGKLLADVMGWTGDSQDAPVLANLTEKDLKALEEQAALKLKEQTAAETAQSEKKSEETVKVVALTGKPN